MGSFVRRLNAWFDKGTLPTDNPNLRSAKRTLCWANLLLACSSSSAAAVVPAIAQPLGWTIPIVLGVLLGYVFCSIVGMCLYFRWKTVTPISVAPTYGIFAIMAMAIPILGVEFAPETAILTALVLRVIISDRFQPVAIQTVVSIVFLSARLCLPFIPNYTPRPVKEYSLASFTILNFIGGPLLVCLVGILLLIYMDRLQSIQDELEFKNKQLVYEQRITTELLHNTLPTDVADSLEQSLARDMKNPKKKRNLLMFRRPFRKKPNLKKKRTSYAINIAESRSSVTLTTATGTEGERSSTTNQGQVLAEVPRLAYSYPVANVMFSDVVGFTELSSRLDANELVSSLNALISQLDLLQQAIGVEKIKTIGDCYLAICVAERITSRKQTEEPTSTSNVIQPVQSVTTFSPMSPLDPACLNMPSFSSDNHTNEEAAQRLLLFAHQLHAVGPHFKLGDTRVTFRTGMACGPIVAGVIGLNRFCFDLWGDTVNTASRMESTGIPDAIQVTPEFYQLVAHTDYNFYQRHGVVVKGKGTMDTYVTVPNSVSNMRVPLSTSRGAVSAGAASTGSGGMYTASEGAISDISLL